MSKTLTDDLRRIVLKPTRGKGKLTSLKTRESIPASKGSAVEAGEDKTSSSTDGGIASPLTEQEETRVYHGNVRQIKSTDGFIVIEYQNVKQVYFKDNNGSNVMFEYVDYTTDDE